MALWLLACAACASATLVNPYGWEIYQYAAHTSGISARRGIDEWLPPSWDQGIGVAWFVSLPIVIGVLGWSWKKGRRVSWREAFLLICFGFLAVRSIRMVIWWLIIIAPMIAVRLADFWPRSRAILYVPSRAAGFTVAGLLTMCVLSLPPLHRVNPLLMVRTPNETMANLDEALELIRSKASKGRIFTKLEWGEYLGWRGYPNWLVNMDGRIEIYSDDVWNQYLETTKGDSRTIGGGFVPQFQFEGHLEDLSVNFLVLDAEFHGRTGLLDSLQKSKRWQETERYGKVIVFERSMAWAR